MDENPVKQVVVVVVVEQTSITFVNVATGLVTLRWAHHIRQSNTQHQILIHGNIILGTLLVVYR